jgi:2-polyprenyl-3-methyl-5-hydroxy-6-metoxy-1,4-benzoquinol methylase
MKNIASHYTGFQAVSYAQAQQQEILNHLGYTLQARLFRPYLNAGDRVLDFGCGNGSLANQLRVSVSEIHGVEVNSLPRELARSQGLTIFEDIDQIPGDIHYSVIISNHVLEHIPNVNQALLELKSRLIASGRLILMLPIDDFRERQNRQWNRRDNNHHLQTWTPLLLANTLREAGFEPIELRIVASAWTPKLFFLGDTFVQALACKVVAILRRRRQLFALAELPR